MGTFSHPVTLGGLSEADHDRICALFERGLGPGRIARALSKHPSTVRGYMLRHGLVRSRQRNRRQASFQRGSETVYLFTREQDALITRLRVEGVSLKGIAAAATKRFGIVRTKQSVHSRLVALAGMEEV